MLSKSILINRLLARLTSDAYCNLRRPTSSSTTPVGSTSGPCVAASRRQTRITRFGWLWAYLLTKCCCGKRLHNCNNSSRRITSNNNQTNQASVLGRKTKKYLHRLSTRELSRLWKVVSSAGDNVGDCILVNQQPVNGDDDRLRHLLPYVEQPLHQPPLGFVRPSRVRPNDEITPQRLITLLRNWSPGEVEQRQLQPLPWCSHHSSDEWHNINQLASVCINPYHWSLLIPGLAFDDFEQFNRPARSLVPIDCGIQSQPLVSNGDHFQQQQQPPPPPPSPPLIVSEQPPLHNQYYPMPSSTPPPSYSEACQQQLTSEIAAAASHQKHLPKSNGPKAHDSKWCRLAYWEYRERVGAMFLVTTDLINVYVDSNADDGWALPTRCAPNENSCVKTRSKIGLGVSIYRDVHNSVWLYNRSTSDIFVNSVTLNPPRPSPVSAVPLVKKVPPGHLVKAYDHRLAQHLRSLLLRSNDVHHGLDQDNNWPNPRMNMLNSASFNLSFVKGFGSNYHRPDIMRCPCWLEVNLEFANERQ